ncbi:MAG: hypothetical protein EPO20_20735 [Betaproteobacteria bacterium]|nr:MAG: hypothetical protein EPO20_20735 [Betaproteobacteria bacterium]
MRSVRCLAAAAGVLLALLTDACAAADWELKVADGPADIQVYVRTTERGYPQFKGVTKIKSTLSAFVALFRDVDNMPNWAYRIREVRTLKRVSDAEVYAYTVNSLPFPLHDRDAIVRSILEQDSHTLKVTIKGSAVPDYVPRDDRYVRMPVVESFWSFTPLGGDIVEVVFQGYGDPGGSLSSGIMAWFIQLSISEAPYYTLLNMHKMISRPEYQAAKYAFIKEAGP